MLTQEKIEYLGIEATRDAITQVERGRTTMRIMRDQICSVSIEYGSPSNRPMVQLVIGVLLIGLGFIPIPWIVHWLLYGGKLPKVIVFTLSWAAIGSWLVWHAISKRTFLRVDLNGRIEKLQFDGKPDPMTLQKFVRQLRDSLGYSVMGV